jgi:ATP-dependent DNA ligase
MRWRCRSPSTRAVFDEQLRSRFAWLRGPKADLLATPPIYVAFDLLYRNDADETSQPLGDRRVLLEDAIIGPRRLVLPARRLAANGLAPGAQVTGRGYEGYVANDSTSPYRGGVTRSWLKVKVPGWTAPEDKFKRVRLDNDR